MKVDKMLIQTVSSLQQRVIDLEEMVKAINLRYESTLTAKFKKGEQVRFSPSQLFYEDAIIMSDPFYNSLKGYFCYNVFILREEEIRENVSEKWLRKNLISEQEEIKNRTLIKYEKFKKTFTPNDYPEMNDDDFESYILELKFLEELGMEGWEALRIESTFDLISGLKIFVTAKKLNNISK